MTYAYAYSHAGVHTYTYLELRLYLALLEWKPIKNFKYYYVPHFFPFKIKVVILSPMGKNTYFYKSDIVL